MDMTPRKTKIEAPKSTAQQLGSIVKSSRDIMRKDKGLNGDLDRLLRSQQKCQMKKKKLIRPRPV